MCIKHFIAGVVYYQELRFLNSWDVLGSCQNNIEGENSCYEESSALARAGKRLWKDALLIVRN